MDVGVWLRTLGLDRYEQVFRDNAIDAEVLPELTDHHLKELGLPLGHRVKLLKAIAALHGNPESAIADPDAQDVPEREASPLVSAPAAAERRQLTIMFVDLVGSTALSARLDPEEMGSLLKAYQRSVTSEVARFEGHIAKFMGDGVLAYFGWPKAHEDDAERAVRAGLAIVGAVTQITVQGAEPLAARVGIATGLVVVGDLIGEGAAQEQAVVGETPNLAARLQSVADAGDVVISVATRKLLGDLFDLADLGLLDLKGFTGPIRAWRVIGEGRAESRFEALHGWQPPPLIGRDQELALLLDRWRRASAGEGQVVLLSGEAGIGKSRILLALRERLRGDEHTSLRYYGSPYHTLSALFPFIEQLERAAGFAREDPAPARLAKLEVLLGLAGADLKSACPIIADLLAIPTTGRYPPLDLAPAEKRARTFEVLLAQLGGLAARQPVLVSVEDVHWFDPTSLELVELLVERIEHLRALLVVTFRPEFAPRWTGRPHVTLLTLSRLGRSDGAALIEELTGGRPLPGEVFGQILAKTDGVPLFIEELTKAVLESGLLSDAGDHYDLRRPLAPLAIPATLQDSLLARLDHLAPVKEVAQVAAVIGREFSSELLAAVVGMTETRLKAALDELVQAELVFRRGASHGETFAFKHALVRDAAYQSLLKTRRQHLHHRIATALEERFPNLAESAPELLAAHLTEAGDGARAVEYWLLAGQRAAERSANLEAIAHLRKGLEVLEMLPETPERARQEFDLQSALGTPLIGTKGFSAPETGKAYARALELYEWVQDPAKLLPVLYRQWVYHAVRAEHQKARELAEQFLRLAQDQGETGPVVVGHQIMGFSLLETAEFAASRVHYEQALALYDPQQHRPLAFDYAQDQRTTILAYYSLLLWLLGYPDQARRARDEGIAWAEQINHANTLGYALAVGTFVDLACRETQPARTRSTSVISLAREKLMPLWGAWGTLVQGWTAVLEERDRSGVDQIRSALATCRAIGTEVQIPFALAILAEAHAALDEPTQALGLLSEALELAHKNGELWWQADLHRLKGEMLLRPPDENRAGAKAEFECALGIAGQYGAKSLKLRAATSLAQLLANAGEQKRAYEVLASVYGWFTEGFDTSDLRQAQTLLDRCGGATTS